MEYDHNIIITPLLLFQYVHYTLYPTYIVKYSSIQCDKLGIIDKDFWLILVLNIFWSPFVNKIIKFVK